MDPDFDFITNILNVSSTDVEKLNVRTVADTTFYEVTLVRKPMICPYCRGSMIGYGHKKRTINHPVLTESKGRIIFNANRYRCKVCGKTIIEDNPFTYEGFNSSYILLRSAMQKLANLDYTLLMISEELNVSRTQVCKYLDSFVTIPKRPLPESLGIDELHSPALAKGRYSYICILVDNENACLYDVLDSRGKFDLAKHFSAIPREERLNVKYVTIDMWEPYRDLANVYFPNCIIAVDPFHVIKHLYSGFDRLRLDLMKQCEYGSNAYYLLKKWHWLLVKNNVDFDNPKEYNHRFGTKLNRRDIFDMIMDTFPILHHAYWLKEQFRKFNQTASFEDACEIYDQYVDAFKDSGIAQFDEFTKILVTWKTEILNSFKRPAEGRRLSNAATENINGKLRAYLTISRGIGNFERFRKRVLFALNPTIFYALTSNLKSAARKGRKRGPYNKPKD